MDTVWYSPSIDDNPAVQTGERLGWMKEGGESFHGCSSQGESRDAGVDRVHRHNSLVILFTWTKGEKVAMLGIKKEKQAGMVNKKLINGAPGQIQIF
jgi:hypothetical protein